MTGEAVPLIPFALDAVFGLVTLGALLVFIVCLGLREGWDHTIGYALRWLAKEVRGVSIDVYFWSIHPLDFLADGLEWIANETSHWLSVAALNAEHAATAMWHLTARVFWWSVHETKALAIDTWHLFDHTIVVTIPNAAKWARREAVAVAHRIVNVEAAARRAADRELGHLAHVAEADAQAGIRAAEHALDWSEAEVGALGRDLRGLEAKVSQIARRLTPAALVALIGATIFKEFGLGWLRCGNVGNAGRRLCGLGTDLVDALLLATLAVEGTVSLVGVAHELVDLTDEFVPPALGFFRELAGVPRRTAEEQGLA